MTAEARWRRRTRTPLLLATAAAWAGLVGSSAAAMNDDMGPGNGMTVLMIGLMVLAMMTPLAVAVVRHVLGRSLPRRRVRAGALLLVPHLLVWLGGGLALLLLARSLTDWLTGPAVLVLGVALVVVWQTSPAAQRCRNGHHSHPAIAAFGGAADRDALCLGLRHAAYCFAACWDLMLLAFLWPQHQLLVMGLTSAWVWALALERPTRACWRLPLPLKAARLLGGRVRWTSGRVASRA